MWICFCSRATRPSGICSYSVFYNLGVFSLFQSRKLNSSLSAERIRMFTFLSCFGSIFFRFCYWKEQMSNIQLTIANPTEIKWMILPHLWDHFPNNPSDYLVWREERYWLVLHFLITCYVCAWHYFSSSILENEGYEKFPISHCKNSVIGVYYQGILFDWN